MRPASRLTAMSSRLRSLVHPVRAWRAFVAALAERADAEAVAVGLTVEVVSNGVHRYRDPRLDQLAAHRADARSANAYRTAAQNAAGRANRVRPGRYRRQLSHVKGAPQAPRRCATAYGGPGRGTPSSAGS